MHQDVHSLDIMTDTDLVESTTVVVDEDLLLYKNAGPSAAPADSVAAQIYQWLGIAATSFPEEVCTFACVVVLHAIGLASLSDYVMHGLTLAQVLASVSQPGEAKYYVYGAGLHMIHVGSPDFRSAAHAACSQDEAEALLADVYSAIFRQFLIAVSGLAGGHARDSWGPSTVAQRNNWCGLYSRVLACRWCVRFKHSQASDASGFKWGLCRAFRSGA